MLNQGRNLLVVPRGGLNDILCQLTRCFVYAQKENRNLIIDTIPSGLRLPMDIIFERKIWAPIFFGDYKSLLKDNPGAIFPHVPVSPDGEIRYEYSKDWGNYISPDLSKPITFDHHMSYGENTLLHLQCGGGDWGHNWFQCVNFTPAFLDKIKDKLTKLPQQYDSVHIRNTDMKTDYQRFFTDIAEDIRGKILLVCSDNNDVIEYARANLPAAEIITLSEIPDNGETPLHDQDSYDQGGLYANALNTFVDLFALALSNNLHISKNISGGFSGFSILAANLFKNKDIPKGMLKISE